ncbi:hypothetical protein ACWCPQ_13625 [Nocardia sp. NPDC001965]
MVSRKARMMVGLVSVAVAGAGILAPSAGATGNQEPTARTVQPTPLLSADLPASGTVVSGREEWLADVAGDALANTAGAVAGGLVGGMVAKASQTKGGTVVAEPGSSSEAQFDAPVHQ